MGRGPYSPSSSPVSLSSSRSVESRLAASTHCPSLLKHTLVMGPGGTHGGFRGSCGDPSPAWGHPQTPQAALTADVVRAELPRAEVVAPHASVHGAAGRGSSGGGSGGLPNPGGPPVVGGSSLTPSGSRGPRVSRWRCRPWLRPAPARGRGGASGSPSSAPWSRWSLGGKRGKKGGKNGGLRVGKGLQGGPGACGGTPKPLPHRTRSQWIPG